MELQIKKNLKSSSTGLRNYNSQPISVDYNLTAQKSTHWDIYDDIYTHELKIHAKGVFPHGVEPDHSVARNGLMSFLYSDVIKELHFIAMEISPRNTEALTRIRALQQQLSSWD